MDQDEKWLVFALIIAFAICFVLSLFIPPAYPASTLSFSGAVNATPNATVNSTANVPQLNLSSKYFKNFNPSVKSICAKCNVTTFDVSYPYGSVINQTMHKNEKAGQILYFPYQVNNTLYVYNVTLVPGG